MPVYQKAGLDGCRPKALTQSANRYCNDGVAVWLHYII